MYISVLINLKQGNFNLLFWNIFLQNKTHYLIYQLQSIKYINNRMHFCAQVTRIIHLY